VRSRRFFLRLRNPSEQRNDHAPVVRVLAETQPQDEDVDRWKTHTVDTDDIDKMYESLRDEQISAT